MNSMLNAYFDQFQSFYLDVRLPIYQMKNSEGIILVVPAFH